MTVRAPAVVCMLDRCKKCQRNCITTGIILMKDAAVECFVAELGTARHWKSGDDVLKATTFSVLISIY
jgi:hypothetical protein